MPSPATKQAEVIIQDSPLDSIEKAVDAVLNIYGKVWPLHTVNACNPLVGFEDHAFLEALKQSKPLLKHHLEDSLVLFKDLYRQQQFTWDNVVEAIEQHPFKDGVLDQSLLVATKTLSYQSVLSQELKFFLTEEMPEHYTFEGAIEQLIEEEILSPPKVLSTSQSCWVDEQLTKWLGAYWDNGQAVWKMPRSSSTTFYDAWLNLIDYDSQVPKELQLLLKKTANNLEFNSLQPLSRVEELFQALSVPDGGYESVIHEQCQSLPGWVGYLKYQQEASPEYRNALYDYLTVRLLYTVAIKQSGFYQNANPLTPEIDKTLTQRLQWISQGNQDFVQSFNQSPEQWQGYFNIITSLDCVAILIRALELYQQTPLLEALTNAYSSGRSVEASLLPKAQAVFCIDVRSEPYRRILESVAAIETYGFAGFFGLAIEGKHYGDLESLPLCPILLSPSYSVQESIASNTPSPLLSRAVRKASLYRQQWIYAFKKIRRDLFATFGYVEALGAIHGLSMVRDSFVGSWFGKAYDAIKAALQSKMGTTYTTQPCNQHSTNVHLSIDLTVEEKAGLVASIIPLMGLRFPLAPFVMMTGHAAQTKNNPYKSSLDCGACGANGGGYNASVLCQWLNEADVRSKLKESLEIPDSTYFIAAEHNTTTQDVIFLNESVIRTQDHSAWQSIKESFQEASRLYQHQLISKPNVLQRQSHHHGENVSAYDWSQTRPEWGLSQNQAFIIGQRDWTKTLNLEGRCFLHSYDWTKDDDESVLSLIMSAPMVVGAWINLQYLFSTLDQQRFGSGKKYTHNVVGLLGAYQGNRSDLQVGLPYESLFSNDGTPYHLPQRLLVCIEAPPERVQRIIDKTPSVKRLVENGWIHLHVFDPLIIR